MKLLLVLVLSLVLTSVQLRAEPTPAVKWLMNEPVSLFDLGLLRLRQANKDVWLPELVRQLPNRELRLGDVGVGSVVYTWEENTISLTAPFIGTPTEKSCEAVLNAYKKIISPFQNRKLAISMFASYFDHINHSSVRSPAQLGDRIAEIFRFTVGIAEKEELVKGKSIFCTSNFFSDQPSFTKYGF